MSFFWFLVFITLLCWNTTYIWTNTQVVSVHLNSLCQSKHTRVTAIEVKKAPEATQTVVICYSSRTDYNTMYPYPVHSWDYDTMYPVYSWWPFGYGWEHFYTHADISIGFLPRIAAQVTRSSSAEANCPLQQCASLPSQQPSWTPSPLVLIGSALFLVMTHLKETMYKPWFQASLHHLLSSERFFGEFHLASDSWSVKGPQS